MDDMSPMPSKSIQCVWVGTVVNNDSVLRHLNVTNRAARIDSNIQTLLFPHTYALSLSFIDCALGCSPCFSHTELLSLTHARIPILTVI